MFLELARERRSIRRFRNKRIEPEKIDMLIQSALLAPSSHSLCPWEFTVVSDPALLDKLSRAKKAGSAFLKNAPLGLVVCGDSTRSDAWIEDCSIAATFVLLAAQSLGLGACWIQIRNRMHDPKSTAQVYVSDLLNLPEHLEVASIIAVGYPAETKQARTTDQLRYEKVSVNTHGTRYTAP
jgi:nitroreductase